MTDTQIPPARVVARSFRAGRRRSSYGVCASIVEFQSGKRRSEEHHRWNRPGKLSDGVAQKGKLTAGVRCQLKYNINDDNIMIMYGVL